MRATAPIALTLGDAPGKWVIAAAVLGSGMAGVDATVVNIALPALGRDLHAGFDGLQWTINGYTLALASLILLGGRWAIASDAAASSWWGPRGSLWHPRFARSRRRLKCWWQPARSRELAERCSLQEAWR